MGLLDSILGGLAGGAMGRSPMGRAGGMGGFGGAGGSGTSRIVMALLPVVLGMLANRQRGGVRGGGFPGMAGGGMGGLGGLGGMAAGMGGIGALIEQISRRGYGQQAQSWVSTGPNEPLPPEAMADVFEPQQLAEIAAEAGLTEDEARVGLSELLPEVVDHFTPEGQIPPEDQLLQSIDRYEQDLTR